MNIKLCYLYRDGGNNKNFGEAIFTNSFHLSLADIEAMIKSRLIDGQWFVAKDWGLPELFFTQFGYDPELDHEWHEYEMVETTEETATMQEDITLFLKRLQQRKMLRF